MSKYWHVIRIGVQSTLVYRFNFLARAAFSLVPLMATLYIWRTIFEGRDSSVSGYSLGKMVTYYLITLLVDTLTAVTDDDWQVAADIKDGNISQFLLRPIDYLTYRFCLFGAGRLIYAAAALIPIGLFYFWHRTDFYLPATWTAGAWFLVSLVLAGFMQFLISYSLALLAFWLLDVSTLIILIFGLEYAASGHLFPLDILPPLAQNLLMWTPFPYEVFFPVSIYLEQITGAAIYQGLAIQACWVIALYGLARWIWSCGIRRYSAVGG
jgi:ABC-2 type transport system permease protein